MHCKMLLRQHSGQSLSFSADDEGGQKRGGRMRMRMVVMRFVTVVAECGDSRPQTDCEGRGDEDCDACVVVRQRRRR